MALAPHSDKVTISVILHKDQDAWLRKRAESQRIGISDVARAIVAAGIQITEIREQAMGMIPLAPLSTSDASIEGAPVEVPA